MEAAKLWQEQGEDLRNQGQSVRMTADKCWPAAVGQAEDMSTKRATRTALRWLMELDLSTAAQAGIQAAGGLACPVVMAQEMDVSFSKSPVKPSWLLMPSTKLDTLQPGPARQLLRLLTECMAAH